ncbi:MAG TPA: phosphatase PAP2 family protein [Nocardioides sp.]|nr:phosphatase PAP2 family protein [Nocardioides sp.]
MPRLSRSLAWLGSFAVVAATVELGWWGGLDHVVDDWAVRQRRTPLWSAAKVVVDVATPEVALPIVLAVGLLVAWRRHSWAIAAEAAFRVGLVVAAVLLLKPLLAIPGPTRNPLGDHGGAFPSGHTTSSVVCMALVLAWVGWPRQTWGRVMVAAVVVGIVGMAVIWARYHFVSDVVGGVLIGLFVATVPLPRVRDR